MSYIDTHCHIHDPEFFNSVDAKKALDAAVEGGVSKMVLIATSLDDSRRTIEFAERYPEHCWASIGIHPHEASKLSATQITAQLAELRTLARHPKVVAVGECGFDFYYNEKKQVLSLQEQLLRGQLDLAQQFRLPISFHVREAFDEFWRVFESYSGLRGVLHSFTDRKQHAERALRHGLKIGVNGIATFTSHQWQRDLFQSLPLESIVVETDAPFLTPSPIRGTINSPKNVIYITNFLAELRGEQKESIAKATTANANRLFDLT